MKVNVLGTEYTVTFVSDEIVCSDISVEIGECGGYCSFQGKEIVIAKLDKCEDDEVAKEHRRKQNLRHEIIHAFLSESGLGSNSNRADCWAKNEEMVDWIAIQGPKIYKAWQEAGAV